MISNPAMSEVAPAHVTPKLHCLGGQEPPPGMGEDLAKILSLSAEARSRYWHVLGPSLNDPVTREAAELLEAYRRSFQLDEDALAHAIKACRFLIREAARLDVSAEQFGEDIRSLHPSKEIPELLLAGFERAKLQVRMEILRGAIADHGNLLVGVDWRIDTMEAADRGVRLKLPVALMTFRYREGSELRRITLQLMPDMLGELRAICDRVLT